MKYTKTEKTVKREWMNSQRIAELKAQGTLESLALAAKLACLDEALYRMGGYGRWIAKKDSENNFNK